MSGPTILFVGGAWHPGHAYIKFTSALASAGFKVAVVDQVPSFNPQPPVKEQEYSCARDADHVRNQFLTPLLDSGEDVVLVVHSYGGVVGACAAASLSKKQRLAQGMNNGVIGIVVVTGFVLPEDMCIEQLFGGQMPPFVALNTPAPNLTVVANEEMFRGVFVSDVPEEMVQTNLAIMAPSALSIFFTPASKTAWSEPEYAGKLAYIKCLKEVAFTEPVVDGMLTLSGTEWITRKLDTSHNGIMHHYAAQCADMVKELVLEIVNQ